MIAAYMVALLVLASGFFDVVSTNRATSRGFHELNPLFRSLPFWPWSKLLIHACIGLVVIVFGPTEPVILLAGMVIAGVIILIAYRNWNL